jgi:hypothetical protein
VRTIRVQARDARGTTGPIFRDTIRLLSSEPTVRAQALRITTDVVTTGGRIPLRAEWRLGGTLATVATLSVGVACGDRQALSVTAPLAGPSAAGVARASLRARSGDRCELEVRALDADGGTMAGHSLGRTVRLLDDDASAVRYTSAWRRYATKGAHDGRTTTSTRAGSRARLTFTGDQVALLATRGPGRGRIRVAIDGRTVATIDLRASKTSLRRIVFARSVAKGTHTIEVRHVKRAGGSVGRVDIDGFLYTAP